MKIKLLFLSILVCGIASAQTNVSGGIFSNTAWTKVNSPYIVTDTVVVFPGVTLTIQPGVVVKFDSLIQLEIRQGKLIALGTAIDSITFTSNDPTPGNDSFPSPAFYSGIYLNGGNLASQFNFCNFQYAAVAINTSNINFSYVLNVKNSNINFNSVGIYCDYIAVDIDSCNFINNSSQGLFCSGSTGVINNSFFFKNQLAVSQPGIIMNSIADSNQVGIIVSGGKILNCIVRNNQTGIESNGSKIDNCTISNNQIGIISKGDSIKNSTLDSNSISAIKFDNPAITVYNCIITNNGVGLDNNNGYFIQSVKKNTIENNLIGIQLGLANSNIMCNKICNNSIYDLNYTGTGNTTVAYNYWCTIDSASTAAVIYDGYDNVNYGLVTFLPIDSTCYLPVSINEFTIFLFDIFPNPSNGKFEIQSSEKIAAAEIFNLVGEKIYSFRMNSGKVEIDLSRQEKGVYFIKINSEKGTAVRKIILQ